MQRIKKPVVFILIDGARYDVLKDLRDQGKLPQLPGDLYQGVTCFPSVTGPAYLPYVAGIFPGTANIPGIRWFDRTQYARRIPNLRRFRSYCGTGSFMFPRDIAKDAVTLFEHNQANANVYNHFQRGVSSKNFTMRYSRFYHHVKSFFTRDWMGGDKAIFAESMKWFESVRYQLPDFTFIPFNAVDEMSHHHNPFSQQVMDSYLLVNHFIGEMKKKFAAAGVDPHWVFSSDHGHTSTSKHIDLVGILKGLKYKTLYHPMTFPRPINAAVMVSGNSMAHIYLKSPTRGWKIPTTSEYVLYHHRPLIDSLLKQEGIDLVILRAANGRIHVLSERGKMWFRVMPSGLINYEVVSGDDPLQLNLLDKKIHLRETLDLTMQTDYPDSLVQLSQIFRSSRTGDIVVVAKPGTDLRGPWEYPEHKSSHGSFHRDQMKIPILSTLPLKGPTIRSVDIYATLCQYLGYPLPELCDGVSRLQTELDPVAPSVTYQPMLN